MSRQCAGNARQCTSNEHALSAMKPLKSMTINEINKSNETQRNSTLVGKLNETQWQSVGMHEKQWSALESMKINEPTAINELN